MRWNDHPIVGLLDLQAARHPQRQRLVLGVVALCCLLALVLPTIAPSTAVLGFCVVHLVLSGICGPSFISRDCVSFVQNLRRGGSLDEVQGTSVSVVDLFDGAALYSLKRALASGIWLFGLFDGLALCRAGLAGGEAVAVLFPLLFLATVLCTVYHPLMRVTWSNEREPLAVTLVQLLPMLPNYLFFYLAYDRFAEGQIEAAGLALLVNFTLLMVYSRTMGCLGLVWAPRLTRTSKRVTEGKSFYARYASNPILWREYSRTRGRGELVRRHLPAALVALAMVASAPLGISEVLLGLMLFVGVLQSAYTAAEIVCRERESGTFDPLLQAGITGRQFTQGVLRASTVPRIIEVLALCLLGIVVNVLVHPGDWQVHNGMLLSLLFYLGVLRGGAAMGLHAALRRTTRRTTAAQACGNLGLWYLASMMSLTLAAVMGLVLGSAAGQQCALCGTAGGILLFGSLFLWYLFSFWGVPSLTLRLVRGMLRRDYHFSV